MEGGGTLGYEGRGVIADAALAVSVASEFGPGTRVVGLEQGFALLPYTDAAYDRFPGPARRTALSVRPPWLHRRRAASRHFARRTSGVCGSRVLRRCR